MADRSLSPRPTSPAGMGANVDPPVALIIGAIRERQREVTLDILTPGHDAYAKNNKIWFYAGLERAISIIEELVSASQTEEE
jgi:hypothetical protein